MSRVETSRAWVAATIPDAFRRRSAAADEETPNSIGELELAPFQRRAVRRGFDVARRFGGVIVADSVGLGKTRVTLGIARDLVDLAPNTPRGEGVWLVVPARLREQWRRAAERARLEGYRLVSHTELSRGDVRTTGEGPNLLVVDEAHRFRNPEANRSRRLARLADGRPVVMATATPVCNDTWDLYELLSVFLGESDPRRLVGRDLETAFEEAERGDFDLVKLIRHVVIRRQRAPDGGDFGERPSVSLHHVDYAPDDDERWIWSNLESELRALSLEALAGEWPRELFVRYVVRRWESGPEALVETLEGLVAYHRRWLEARACGRRLNRSSFRALFEGDEDQEVFPFLFPEGDERGEGELEDDRGEAVERVERDRRRLMALLERANAIGDRTSGIAAALGELASGPEKWLVFTRYRRAARGLYRSLCDEFGASARIGIATGEEARATGLGRSSLDELLRRFAPNSYADRELAEHQQLRLLVATDCLSEGVNLQQCGRVVLADLPYSALLVEQRIGRVVRPGGPHDEVEVYLPRPYDWEDTLGMQRRLERKLASAERAGATLTRARVLREENGAEERRASGAGDACGDDGGERWAGPGAAAEPAPREEPLAAMTRLDGLAARLDGVGEGWERGHFVAPSPDEAEALWVHYAVDGRTNDRGGWLLVDDSGAVECRRTRLVRPLVALADAELPVRRTEPPERLVAAAREWLERVDERFRAVACAPFPLDVESPQCRIWRRICAGIRRDKLEWKQSRVEEWRDRLLRPFPRGTRYHLDELVDATESVHVLVERVDALLGDRRVRLEEVEHRMVATLWLRPQVP